MDIGELFKALDRSTKEMAISLVLIFPMVYIDCWKLNDNFKELDILPQMMLCGGVSVVALLAGMTVSVLCFGVYVSWKKTEIAYRIVDKLMINSYAIVTPIGFCTASVLGGMVESVNSFEGVYLGSGILLISGLMILQLFNKSDSTEEIESIQQKETQKEEINA